MTSLRISAGLAIILTAALYAPASTRGVELHTAIDRLVEDAADGKFAAQATDQEFLRRLFLDLTGEIPAPNDVAEFVANSGADKRIEMVYRLLQDESYDFLLFDEMSYMFKYEYLDVEPVVKALQARPEMQNVMITGRTMATPLQEIADTISTVQDDKHAFRQGVKAQEGIEF